jgi:hypothetical protein
VFNIEEVKKFFSWASVERFEGRIATINILGNHLAEVCTVEKGPWKYVFFRSRIEAEVIGFVVLWHDGIPVWKMSLGGPYTREAGPILKAAILAALNNNEFYGGRGPAQYIDSRFPGYEYRNTVQKSDFSDFSGREEVFLNGQSRGWHWYHGGTL